jgi:hypothetical protein
VHSLIAPAERPRIVEDLRQSWQSRMLRETQKRSIGAAVLSMMAHAYDAEVLQTLLQVSFPGFQSIRPPFLCSAGKVHHTGQIVADIVDRQECMLRDQVIFRGLGHMQDVCRRLADRMKLTDAERLEFFTIAKRWVVADRRLDPTMNPADPDARRLVH